VVCPPLINRFIVPALERILLTLWIGGLWIVGLVVVPALFAHLPDSATAGSLAGVLFTLISRIGLVAGGLLLVLCRLRNRCRQRRRQLLMLIGMLVLVVAGEFVLAPQIAGLRAVGAVASPQFARLHGLAGGVYLVNCVLGLALLVTWKDKP